MVDFFLLSFFSNFVRSKKDKNLTPYFLWSLVFDVASGYGLVEWYFLSHPTFHELQRYEKLTFDVYVTVTQYSVSVLIIWTVHFGIVHVFVSVIYNGLRLIRELRPDQDFLVPHFGKK